MNDVHSPPEGVAVERKVGRQPKGVVAVLIDGRGREVAHAAAFGLGAPAGFTPREFQESRARRALALAAVRELASPLLADAVDQYQAERILNSMCNQGARVAICPVGWDE